MTIAYSGSTCPTGFLATSGQSVLKTTYPNLFASIGNTYGGSGLNFTLPDYRGLFLRGAGTNGTATQSNGSAMASAALGTVQTDQMQGHTHSNNAPSNIDYYIGTGGIAGNSSGVNDSLFNLAVGSPTSDGTNGTPRTGGETRPANTAINYCIKF